MVRADMLTKSRSFLVSLIAGLALVAGSVGCDVEDASESDDVVSDEVVEIEETGAATSDLTASAKTDLIVERTGHASRVDASRVGPDKTNTATRTLTPGGVAPRLVVTSESNDFLFDGTSEQDQGESLLTFGSTKSEPDPDPWSPGEPDPDPWMPNSPDNKNHDDRR